MINDDLTADEAATSKLRAKLVAERKSVKLFDRGFDSIDEAEGALQAGDRARTAAAAPVLPARTRAQGGSRGMSDRYSQVGYASAPIGGGRRPAVLVVDLQLAFTDPRFPLGGLPMVHAARDRTVELLAVARERKLPVAACYTAYASQADMPHWKVKAVREEFLYGHPCTAMDPRIDHPDNFTYCKNAASMFFQTPLMTFLTRQAVDTVIVTGCTTSGCVRATVVDAFSHGLRVLVAEECCGDADERQHAANLEDVGRRYADVMTTADVVRYIESVPA